MIKKVKIDYKRLCEEIRKSGKTKEGFSLELGRSKSYICGLKEAKEQPESVEKVMCLMLGLEPGSLVQDEPDRTSDGAKVFENVYKKISALEEMTELQMKYMVKISAIEQMIESQMESMEKILSKVNANTVQLEKVKDSVKDLGKTDYEKASEFLREVLSGGRMISEEILLKSDARGIKRADLMKAKKDMQVDQATTGYGKNQKTWWCSYPE